MAQILSGQITVTTAGTEVQGTAMSAFDGVNSGFYIRYLSSNTGIGYVGNDGTGAISSTTGHEFSPGDMIYVKVSNLNELWFDSSANGDKFSWIKA